ncbi:MAG: extracellular solute-binding protein [Ardenticatenaceae bacterium]|nr:extracellular solute-binding protein [Ardenticatenaceae bacterium]
MKRSNSLSVILFALLLGLAGCGQTSAPPEATAPPAAQPTPPPAGQPTSAPAFTEAPQATSAPTEAAGAARTVTLKMILVAPEDRWNFLLDKAKTKFEADHPDTRIEIDAQILPFGDRLTQLRAAATGGTPLDIVSLDQPEVGEFAAAGFTTDLTDWINRDLNGLEDWLPAYREATKYQGHPHAIWAWTDARVLWYWKDLVQQAGVDPATDMRTWDGYIQSCQKLDQALADQKIQGCLLIGQPWIADWTLPYAWMNGGDIGVDVNPDLASKQGAAEAWVPTFDSDAWVKALQFTEDQVNAGIEPFTEHQFGPAFVARRFATWLGGTWVFGSVKESGADMSNLALVAAFPVPSQDVETATMAGGWTLAVPATSEHPDVAWEFLKAMLDKDTLGAMQTRFGYLPTEESFATGLEEQFSSYWNDGDPNRWSELQSLAPHAYGRPSFPTWPQVGAAITQMVQQVMFEKADPQETAKATQHTVLVDVLKWPDGTRVELHDDAGEKCEHPDMDRAISAVTPWEKAADTDGNGTICSHVALP